MATGTTRVTPKTMKSTTDTLPNIVIIFLEKKRKKIVKVCIHFEQCAWGYIVSKKVLKKNSATVQNVSQIVSNCPKISQNVPKCPNMSQKVPRCPKTSQNVKEEYKCSKMSQQWPKVPKMSQNIPKWRLANIVIIILEKMKKKKWESLRSFWAEQLGF